MASAHDVAAMILEREQSALEAFKLQKLVYYCQAWNLVATDEPLFTEPVKAYENGPVVGVVFNSHRGRRWLSARDLDHGSSENLTDAERDLISAVCDAYEDLSTEEIVDLTHREDPWKNAWARRQLNDRIPQSSMREFYARVSAIPVEQRSRDQRVPVLKNARIAYVCRDDIVAMDTEDDEPSVDLIAAVHRARANLG